MNEEDDCPAEILRMSMKDGSAIAFSGGLDSSFLAFVARNAGIYLKGYVVGLDGSHDILWAQHAARLIDLELETIIVGQDEILDAFYRVAELIGTENPVTVSFEMPLYFVGVASEENVIITGQGADELFGGYKRYENMDPETLEFSMEHDLDNLLEKGLPREKNMMASLGKELITPYLEGEFLKRVLIHTPMERKGSGRKSMLRNMAIHCGLPGELAMKGKKAAQYGSGIMKVLKKNREKLIKMENKGF